MVDFVQLQNVLKMQLELDREIRVVSASGPTLEAAIADAAALLNISIKRLEYEITGRGSPGFFGTGKKDWIISAYKRKAKVHSETSEAEDSETDESVAVVADRDGDAFVQLSRDGVLLKVTPPKGRGRRASEADAMYLIRDRGITDYDISLVDTVVREAAGIYVRVGKFEHRISNDSWVKVEVSEDEMQAYITVSQPELGGCDIPLEGYYSFLKNNRVVHGINEEQLSEFADRPKFKERILMAEGTKPEDGRDSYISYNFDVDQEKRGFKEGSNGRVDFKDLNKIRNVVENQPLAKRIPPEKGTPGRTVTGKSIPAKSGKEFPLPLGTNVHEGDDGATIISDISGQVNLLNGKINVEPIYNVDGDVNLKTGNIDFLGTVVVNGNVEDGFVVRSAGNIEVHGTIGKSELIADGDIIVQQGIMGKGGGIVKAGRSIWARFIENSHIESGSMVIVTDGIINSQVDAYKYIICQGKRAHIVGGTLRASEEINAKTIGSPTSGTETICEVGIDPKNKIMLETYSQNKISLTRELDEITRNVQNLVNIKQQRKSLPEDKENTLRELIERRETIVVDLRKITDNTARIEEQIRTSHIKGKVSASQKVYPGVKVIIQDMVNEVRTEYKAVTFILEDNLIRVSKYEDPANDVKMVPDGYTTD
ncbi:MAG: FapA family protein [Treponema sp.]|jgi:uncharacterized protein (DUF342 family)|nr:FapA family protein [Treponema sp.]